MRTHRRTGCLRDEKEYRISAPLFRVAILESPRRGFGSLALTAMLAEEALAEVL